MDGKPAAKKTVKVSASTHRMLRMVYAKTGETFDQIIKRLLLKEEKADGKSDNLGV